MRYILFALVLCMLVGVRTAPVYSQSAQTCHEDLNADSYADGSDITLLAGYFGKPASIAPAGYDLWPRPGDGWVDGTDITHIAGIFGQHCLGVLTLQEPLPEGFTIDGVPEDPYIWGCNATIGVWSSGVWYNHHVEFGTGWYGETACAGNNYTFRTQCTFALQSRPPNGDPWQTVAVTPIVTWTGGATAGLYCAANGIGAGYAPCGTVLVGYVEHRIWEAISMDEVHPLEGHWIVGDSGWGISIPPC